MEKSKGGKLGQQLKNNKIFNKKDTDVCCAYGLGESEIQKQLDSVVLAWGLTLQSVVSCSRMTVGIF